MKNNLLSIILLTLSFSLFAQNRQEVDKELLVEVNKEWLTKTNADYHSAMLNADMDDYELIRNHLMLVEQSLRAKDISDMPTALQKNRSENLNHLNDYWKQGAFPINTSLSYRNPVFIDEFNNYCAVGYLIKASGHDSLARKIANEINYGYLRDIQTEGLSEWAESSGFTVDELAWIQPSYPPNTFFNKMGEGTNGIVYDATLIHQGNVVVAGSFTNADGSPASNIAEWVSGINGYTWIEVGGGINGTVKSLLYHDNVLYAGGSITKAGGVTVSNIAKWNSTAWTAMGTLNGTVNDLIVYKNKIYAAGKFSGTGSNHYENIALWNGTHWTSILPESNMDINGEVDLLAVIDDQLIIGGSFTQAGTIAANNIVQFDGTTVSDLSGGLPARVRAIEEYDNRIYAAGDFVNGTDTFGIASYDGAEWKNLLYKFGYPGEISDYYIATMERDGSRLLMGGYFFLSPFIGTYARNAAYYDGAVFDGLADLDSTVHVMTNSNEFVYVGGAFKTVSTGWSGSTVDINSISYINSDPAAGIDDPSTAEKVIIFPNPVNDRTVVSLDPTIKTKIRGIQIYDMSGKLIRNITNVSNNQVEIFAGDLAKGQYVLNVIDDHGSIGSQKLVIN